MRKVFTSLLRLLLVDTAIVTVASILGLGHAGAVQSSTASLATDVEEYITLSITAGSSVDFGPVTPGLPNDAPSTGTVASVTTSAANGYNLAVHDGSDANSALRHTDGTTYIPDHAGTIALPTSWVSGLTKGVGITLFQSDSAKEAGWGTGTSYNDSDNKYAGVPAVATVVHTVSGYHPNADTSTWAFRLDVPNSQKTGTYSGNITFTATGIL